MTLPKFPKAIQVEEISDKIRLLIQERILNHTLSEPIVLTSFLEAVETILDDKLVIPKEFVAHLEKLKKLYAVPTDASEIYRKPSQIIEKVLEAFKG